MELQQAAKQPAYDRFGIVVRAIRLRVRGIEELDASDMVHRPGWEDGDVAGAGPNAYVPAVEAGVFPGIEAQNPRLLRRTRSLMDAIHDEAVMRASEHDHLQSTGSPAIRKPSHDELIISAARR